MLFFNLFEIAHYVGTDVLIQIFLWWDSNVVYIWKVPSKVGFVECT